MNVLFLALLEPALFSTPECAINDLPGRACQVCCVIHDVSACRYHARCPEQKGKHGFKDRGFETSLLSEQGSCLDE